MKIPHSIIFPLLALGLFLFPPPVWSVPSPTLTGTVNLNSASPAELGLLPGIGPVKAAQIIAARQKQPFQSLEDLKKIRGLGAKRIEALRPHVGFMGPTTARHSAPPSAETQPTLGPLP
jgi:competence ComEA-like helix-hairpin-helix protein